MSRTAGFWVTRLSRQAILMGSTLWAAHWSLQESYWDYIWRRQNGTRKRPRDLGLHPTGDGWSRSRAAARMVWREVFYPYPMCTNQALPLGLRAPRPGVGFGTGFGCAEAEAAARR